MEMAVKGASMGIDGKRVQRSTVVFNMAGYQNVFRIIRQDRRMLHYYLELINSVMLQMRFHVSIFPRPSQCSSNLR